MSWGKPAIHHFSDVSRAGNVPPGKRFRTRQPVQRGQSKCELPADSQQSVSPGRSRTAAFVSDDYDSVERGASPRLIGHSRQNQTPNTQTYTLVLEHQSLGGVVGLAYAVATASI